MAKKVSKSAIRFADGSSINEAPPFREEDHRAPKPAAKAPITGRPSEIFRDKRRKHAERKERFRAARKKSQSLGGRGELVNFKCPPHLKKLALDVTGYTFSRACREGLKLLIESHSHATVEDALSANNAERLRALQDEIIALKREMRNSR